MFLSYAAINVCRDLKEKTKACKVITSRVNFLSKELSVASWLDAVSGPLRCLYKIVLVEQLLIVPQTYRKPRT